MIRRVLHPFRLLLVAVAACTFCAGFPPAASAAPYLLSGFPRLKQQHTLTCEASAASMGTRGTVTESQIMAVIPRNQNPNVGFRGNPDGYQHADLLDYGVYANPIHGALFRYGYASDVLTYSNNNQIAGYVARGWPVVVWVTYQLMPETPRLMKYDGVNFILVPREHALLIVGYGPNTILANDPWTAKRVRYTWEQFDRSWGYFGNMALAIAPCAMAQPVQAIHQSGLSTAQVSWTWPRAANAARYRVKVVRRGKPNSVIYQADQVERRVIVSNPTPGMEYDISVQALSACGSATIPTGFASLLPASLPAPTPTPTRIEGTIVPTSTATSTPTSTVQPTTTPTVKP